jgi:nicotinamidase-related amidase
MCITPERGRFPARHPYMAGGYQQQIFAVGDWGGEWHPDFAPQSGDLVATEHWNSSGFANTNLDTLLKQKGITHVVLIGLIANTCIESTGKYAAELGYHVTLVRDATAAARAASSVLARLAAERRCMGWADAIHG